MMTSFLCSYSTASQILKEGEPLLTLTEAYRNVEEAAIDEIHDD